jgi:hypothetical protein
MDRPAALVAMLWMRRRLTPSRKLTPNNTRALLQTSTYAKSKNNIRRLVAFNRRPNAAQLLLDDEMRTDQLNSVLACGVAVVVFAALHATITAVTNRAAQSADYGSVQRMLIVIAYAAYFVAGLVAGLLSRRREVLNGLIAGGLSVAVAVLVFGIARGDAAGVAALAANGVVLGAAGGLCWRILRGRRAA